MTHSAENDAPTEPLLVSGMRHRPSGEVRHLPLDGRGMTGTTTRGFLAELDDWRRQCMARAWDEGAESGGLSASQGGLRNPYVTPPGQDRP
jgi:hypothetical protein